jgi:hypothetical protein
MPLPAWLISGIILGVSNYLRKEVFAPKGTSIEPQPDWGDGGKENPRPDTKPPTVPPQIKPNPINFPPVYTPPKNPYVSPSYDNDNNPPVTKAPPRLPLENLDQSGQNFGDYEGVTLQEAVANRAYGALLHSPYSAYPQKARIAVDLGLSTKLNDAATAGAQAFTQWLGRKSSATLYDAIALIVPDQLKSWEGDIGLLFGIEPLLVAANHYSDLAQNARLGVSDTIPLAYDVKFYKPKPPQRKLDSKLLGLISQFDWLDILGKDFWGQDLKIEDWLENAIATNYDTDKWTQNPVKIETLPQLIRHVAAVTYFRLGLNELPFTVPETLNQDLDDNDEQKEVDLQSLAQYQIYFLQALDSVLGQFPIKIKIEDSDLIQTGSQELEIDLPNLAETLAEMVGQNLSNQAFIKALIEIGLKNLAETGQTKQQAVQNYYAALANQEYLGYKVKQKAKDIDFVFNPAVTQEKEEDQSLTKALENRTLKVIIDEFDDEQTLDGQMKILIEAARIIKGRFWRGIDLGGDAAGAIAQIIKSAVAIGENSEEGELSDLDAFFESVKKGFTNRSTELNSNKPYDRDADRAPKIKKLKLDKD